MGKRILWDILCLALVFSAPWWLTLAVGTVGALFFSWYAELVILGALYDALFGGVPVAWYRHLVHTGIFAAPLLVIEFVKANLNLHAFQKK